MEKNLNNWAQKLIEFSNRKNFKQITDAFNSLFTVTLVISLTLFLSEHFIGQFIDLTNLIALLRSADKLFPLLIIYCLNKEVQDPVHMVLAFLAFLFRYPLLSSYQLIPIAIIISFLVSLIIKTTRRLTDKIKLPKSVPSNVTALLQKFSNYLIVLFLMYFIMSIDFIWNPLTINMIGLLNILSHPVVYFVIVLFASLFWSLGIHGDMVTAPYLEPIIIMTMISSMFMADSTYMINTSFHIVFFGGTGTGMTLCLLMAIRFFSNYQEEKEIVQENLVSGIVNINEGVIFGLPIVDHKLYRIPFVLVPLVSVIYGYVLTGFNIIPVFQYAVPWVMPPLIKSYIASGGSWIAVMAELGSYVLGFIIYSFFVLKNKRSQRS